MASERAHGIAGRRLLVVEDEYLIASDLSFWLEEQGAQVIGPVPSVADALELLETGSPPDAAVLDINLGDELVFPVADALEAAHVPFIFLSGYDAKLIPADYGSVRRCGKPLERSRLLHALGELLQG